jgi:hypothetical protein
LDEIDPALMVELNNPAMKKLAANTYRRASTDGAIRLPVEGFAMR